MKGAAVAAAVITSLGFPAAASAHEVLHAIERGRAIAVKAYFADGEALAYCQYEIFSPAEPKIPHQKGRTDRNGYLSFVPDSPGRWRVKVVDVTGHGLDTEVDVGSPKGAAPGSSEARASGPGAAATAAFVLRPLVGIAAIAVVFVALIVFQRRRGGRS